MNRPPAMRSNGLAIATILIVGVVLFLSGCGDQEPRDAVVEDFSFVREGSGDQVIRGVLVNTADKYIRGARISVDLYEDENGAPSDSMSFEVRDLDPGESKPFQYPVDTNRRLAGARISQIVLF